MIVFVLTDTSEYCFNKLGAIPVELNKQTSVALGISVTATFVTSVTCLSKV